MTDPQQGWRCQGRRCVGRVVPKRQIPAKHQGDAASFRRARRVLLPAAVPLMLLAACHARAKDPPTAAPLAVHVAVASNVTWPMVVTVPATVSAVDVAVLASRAGGWVTRVDVAAGAHVAENALLIAVGLPAAQEQLAAAKARLSAAQATFNEAAANQHRFSVLRRTHATSQRQYDAAERAFITAKAELAAAHSALTAAKSNLGYAEIRAPFAGTVVSKNVWRGEFATPGTPLLTIAGSTPEIRAHVGPATYRALETGEMAAVEIDGARQFAVITRVVAAADPGSRTHLIELQLPQGTTAPFGAYAELHLTLGHHPQLAVPEAALTRRAGLSGVFVIDKDKRAHFRLVRTGAVRNGRVAVVAGLSKGETVVLAPPARLVSNTLVRPEPSVSGRSSAETSRD